MRSRKSCGDSPCTVDGQRKQPAPLSQGAGRLLGGSGDAERSDAVKGRNLGVCLIEMVYRRRQVRWGRGGARDTPQTLQQLRRRIPYSDRTTATVICTPIGTRSNRSTRPSGGSEGSGALAAEAVKPLAAWWF